MKRIIFSAAGTAILLISFMPAAMAESGYAGSGADLRSGPGHHYAPTTYIRRGERVEILSCLRGFGWCEVGWRGHRGWLPGGHLSTRDSFGKFIDLGQNGHISILTYKNPRVRYITPRYTYRGPHSGWKKRYPHSHDRDRRDRNRDWDRHDRDDDRRWRRDRDDD